MSIVKIAKEIFENQKFTKYIGAKLDLSDEGIIRISLEIEPHHLQQHHYVHGGVIGYLADNSLTFAGGIALGADSLTSEYKINYIRPAVGKILIAEARAVSTGSSQSVCVSEVFSIDEDNEKKLCAFSTGTIVKAREKTH